MYISIDGDNVGKKIEGMIIMNELEKLYEFSNKVSSIQTCICRYIEDNGGKCYLSAGDSVLADIPDRLVSPVIEKIKYYQSDILVYSIGIGNNTIDAFLALKHAKSFKSDYACYKDESGYLPFIPKTCQ